MPLSQVARRCALRYYRCIISIPALSIHSRYWKSRELAESRYFGKSHKSTSLLKASEIGRARCSLPVPSSSPCSPASLAIAFPTPSRIPQRSYVLWGERARRHDPKKDRNPAGTARTTSLSTLLKTRHAVCFDILGNSRWRILPTSLFLASQLQ